MTADAFRDEVLREFYRRMHERVADNYDAGRFSHDGVDRSEEVNVRERALHLAVFTRWYAEFYESWTGLADDESKGLYAELIQYRLLGHLHVKIRPQVGWSQEQALFERARSWRTGESELPFSGAFGALDAYRAVPFEGRLLDVDCWAGGIVYTYLKRQYLYDRQGVRIRPEPGDTVLDLGACLGDTTVGFAACVGPSGRVYAFDPLPAHVEAIRHNIALNGFDDIMRVVPRAVADRSNDLPALDSHAAGVNPGFRIVEEGLPLITVDRFVNDAGLDRVDFIKMDIEGAEPMALTGAIETLRRHRPKLAISIYHQPTDFFSIPRWLSRNLPDYEFHLDHYTIHGEETVLFGRSLV